jgi:diacylglycerol kinase family enzyme
MGIWKPECMRSILRAGAVRAVPVGTVTAESMVNGQTWGLDPFQWYQRERERPNRRGICGGGV